MHPTPRAALKGQAFAWDLDSVAGQRARDRLGGDIACGRGIVLLSGLLWGLPDGSPGLRQAARDPERLHVKCDRVGAGGGGTQRRDANANPQGWQQ